MHDIKGCVHSIETCGTVDGPGIRYVVFLQGCPLRCKYCHNPDTWGCHKGQEYEAKEIVGDILKYKNFIKTGGVTLSGGEPLMQWAFSKEILQLCEKNGIHTAIDTSGIIPVSVCKEAVDSANLILLDIKHIDDEKCRLLTGTGNKNSLDMLEYCERTKKVVWIRQVIVPGFTDDITDAEKTAVFLSRFSVIKRIEILPFHKMGEYKWKQLELEYSLENIREPTKGAVNNIKSVFGKYDLNVI